MACPSMNTRLYVHVCMKTELTYPGYHGKSKNELEQTHGGGQQYLSPVEHGKGIHKATHHRLKHAELRETNNNHLE